MTKQNQGGDTADHGSDPNADPKNKNANDQQPDANKNHEQIAKDQKARAEKAEADLKIANSSIADLQKQLEGKADDHGNVSTADIEAIAEKHGVDPNFAKDLAGALKSEFSKEVKATEDKLGKEINKAETERNQEKLNQAFKAAFDAVTEDYGDDAVMSEQAVKDLYLARKGANPELTVAEVVKELYGEPKGSPSSEDDAGAGDRGGGETIDFATLSKDPEKLSQVIKDPKAKSAYYAWRDKQGI